MYTDFYKLKEKPFNLTPSPRFLYLSESHREALAYLTYGVMEREGFSLLVGDVGTGKTTVIQTLLSKLHTRIQYVYLSDPLLTPKDFRDHLLSSTLDKKVRLKSKADFFFQFKIVLEKCRQQEKNFVLIIDEAQALSFELLEEIRLLSNIEYTEDKLISIFFVGQPEINSKLSDLRCRPLLQRISLRYQIPPLNLEDTTEYVATRLRIAGAKTGHEIFSERSVLAIYEYSEGYPRVINILADNALLLGYSKEKRKISGSMIKSCHEDLQLQGPVLESSSPKAKALQTRRAERPQIYRHWKWAALLLFVITISVLAMSWNGKSIFGRLVALMPATNQAAPDRSLEVQIRTIQKANQKSEDIAGKDSALDKIAKAQVLMKERPGGIIQDSVRKSHMEVADEVDAHETTDKPAGEQETPALANYKKPWKTVIVKEGDTVAELAVNEYGRADEGVLDLIRKHNRDIKDINRIKVGQKLIFPAFPLSDKGPTFTVHVASFEPFEHARVLFQKLIGEGYEVFIMPMHDARKGKVFRVTIGNFRSLKEAKDYATTILEKDVFDYAKPIRIEMK